MTKDIYKGCRPYGAQMEGLPIGVRGFAPTANRFRPYGALTKWHVLYRGLAPTAIICRPYGAPVSNKYRPYGAIINSNN